MNDVTDGVRQQRRHTQSTQAGKLRGTVFSFCTSLHVQSAMAALKKARGDDTKTAAMNYKTGLCITSAIHVPRLTVFVLIIIAVSITTKRHE